MVKQAIKLKNILNMIDGTVLLAIIHFASRFDKIVTFAVDEINQQGKTISDRVMDGLLEIVNLSYLIKSIACIV